MEEEIEYLKSNTTYGNALEKSWKNNKKSKDFEFEILLAHQCESNNLELSYEESVNPENEKTVDFATTLGDIKINIELVRVGLNKGIRALQESKNSGELTGYTLESDATNPDFQTATQAIKLQMGLLEKVHKFIEVSSTTINIICVDCTNFHVGRMDHDDVAVVMWGKPYNPFFGEHFNGERIKGILEDSYEKRGSDLFKTNISAVIFVPRLKHLPLNYAYMAINNRQAGDHIKLVLETIGQNNPFTEIKICRLP